MALYAFLVWTPLANAIIWFALVVHQVRDEHYRTWTEVFLIGLCLCVGLYGLSDALFFSSPNIPEARVAAAASLTSLTFASAFIFLYGMTLHARLRRSFLLVFLPAVALAIVIPQDMFLDFTPLTNDGPPYVPLYNLPWFLLWAAFLTVLVLAGIWGVYRTSQEIKKIDSRLARRINAILWGFIVAVVLGLATNTFFAVSRIPLPPLFSSSLAIPGALIFLAVSPASFERLNDAVLRRKAANYDIRAVFLTYSDGTLIGSTAMPDERMIDADSFSATLDVIQNFMHSSFPTLRGKWLQSIRHGDYTLVMERGKHTALTVVLDGEENDQLRRKIIEGLHAFENRNMKALENWRGMAKDAVGTDDLLSSLLTQG